MPSWKRSRDSALWRSLDPADAAQVTRQSHGDDAGAEVLLRAFLCERDLQREAVRFWLTVYRMLAPDGPDGPTSATERPPSSC